MKYSNLILKVAFTAFVAFALTGCLAKGAPKTTYYELDYESNSACAGVTSEKTSVYIAPITALNTYESRMILSKSGAEVKYLPNSKFIAYPSAMFAKSLSNYLDTSCDFKQTLDSASASVRLKIRIIELNAGEENAVISVLARCEKANGETRDAKLTARKKIADFSEGNALAALNEANADLIGQIAEFLRY